MSSQEIPHGFVSINRVCTVFMAALSVPYISLFPLCERLSELWSLCSSGGLQASSAAVVFCRDCVAVSPTHQIQTHRRTHKHTNTRTCLVSVFLPFCLFLSVLCSTAHMHRVSAPPHPLHLDTLEPICLSFLGLFFLVSFPPPLSPPSLPAVLYS